MSGIAGIIRFDGGPHCLALVEKMTSAMAHRGPDGIRQWCDGSAALGHCMLWTTPESLDETLPLESEDRKLVLVLDGRVDNWEELRGVLTGQGINLRDRSDAELAIKAFERWSHDCLDHIDGDFAFVIWDKAQQEIFCARDRFGVKPFYYHCDGKTFSFASEISALLDLPWVPRVLNEGYVAEWLGGEWHSDNETFWQGVMKLPPGSSMVVEGNGIRIANYWQPDVTPFADDKSDEEYQEQYRVLLWDAVRRQSRSHRPLACEVSGGLDSSALYSVAEHLGRDGKLLAPGLKGYTLRFEADGETDDLPYARAVGEFLGRPVQEIMPTALSLGEVSTEVQRNAEFPQYPNGFMGNGIKSAAAARGCRAMLIGIGGDEVLSGGRNYYAEALASFSIARLRRYLIDDAREVGILTAFYWLLRHGAYRLLPAAVKGYVYRKAPAAWRGQQYKPDHWLAEPLAQELCQRRKHREAKSVNDRAYAGDNLLLSTQDPYGVWCREREGLVAAELQLEQRYPFLTRKLAEFLFRLPSRQRVRGRHAKFMHRRAMSGFLPPQVLQRDTKANFMKTFQPYMKGLDDSALDRPDETQNWINLAGLKRISSHHSANELGGWPAFMLWTLYGCALLRDRSPDNHHGLNRPGIAGGLLV